jgi:hypothetical protein
MSAGSNQCGWNQFKKPIQTIDGSNWLKPSTLVQTSVVGVNSKPKIV